MSLKSELLALDEQLWSGGEDTYRQTLDDDCLVAFTGMAGVSSRDDVAGTVGDGPRWRELDIEFEGVLQPTPDVAILTYRANAVRDQGERYRALVSSGYVKRNGSWKMMFHQQTPLG